MKDKPIRLLIVEDDKDDYLLLQKMLAAVKKSHFELDQASTYKEAIEKLDQNTHDVCLLDYRLEGHNGLDFLKEAAQRGGTIPIIFLTGQGDYEVDMEAMQLGAADFLNKNKIDALLLERSIRYALERRKADENLRQREEFFREIIENSLNGVAIVDSQGIRYLSAATEQILGYSPEEIKQINIRLLHPEDQPRIRAAFEKIFKTPNLVQDFLFRVKHKNGAWRTLEIFVKNSMAVKSIQGVVVNFHDVTERQKGLETTSRLATILENSNDAVVACDLNGMITHWNHGAEMIYGYTEEEVMGRPVAMLLAEDNKDENRRQIEIIKRGESLQHFESVRRKKGGRLVNVSISMSPYKDLDGKIIGLSAIVRDITERKKIEEVQAQLAGILEQTPDAVIGSDLEGHVLSWNNGAAAMFGYSLDEIVGKPVSCMAPPDRQHESREMREIVASGESIANLETVRVRKNGALIDVSITLFPMRDASRKITRFSAIVRDITERKKAEESLKKHEERMRLAEKMNAIGRLAAGVAHDFNNLLSVIGGNAEFILSALPQADPSREELEEIQKAVGRGAELTKQLLVFGQKQVSQPQPVDLNEISLEMKKMLKRLFNANIELFIIQDKQLFPILADPGQMQEIILNLALNANDAMPKGGQLIIETKNILASSLALEERPTLPPGAYVRLTATDTGMGMDPETQKRVFEPFFTTKAGKGTGLGLATVYGIVMKWSGHIFLHSSPGIGTTFTLYFPALPQGEAPLKKPKQIALISQGSETLLVAEDEEPVRKVLVRSLEKYGYRVLEARNAIEAVQKAWGYKDPIHLLVTDAMMPKMNGWELAEELKKNRPKIKVIFISGYPRDVLSQQGVLGADIHLVQKPFEMEDLARQVRKLLDEK